MRRVPAKTCHTMVRTDLPYRNLTRKLLLLSESTKIIGYSRASGSLLAQ